MIIQVQGGFIAPRYICAVKEHPSGNTHVFTIDGREWVTELSVRDVVRSMIQAHQGEGPWSREPVPKK